MQLIAMIELVIACFIGILIGTLTGMIPGIHVNTAGAILFASSAVLLQALSADRDIGWFFRADQKK